MTHADAVPQTKNVSLPDGRTLVLYEFSMLEWSDLEEFTGASATEILQDVKAHLGSVRLQTYLAWLLTRKHGKTPEQQAARQWAQSFEQFQVGLSMPAMMVLLKEVLPFLVGSASSLPSEPSPEPAAPSGSDTGKPSPSPSES